MHINPNLQSTLNQLNPEQRRAVEQIFGTVLVIAGPGTGKTQMLTARIANILQETDTDPGNILCLTFTDSGAIEMRNRLQRWIGPDAYKVQICTFHAFCQKVIMDYPELFASLMQSEGENGHSRLQDDEQGGLADELQQALIFRKIIDSKSWKNLKPFGDNYLWQRPFLSALSTMKRENISQEKFLDLIPKEKEHMESDPDNFYKRDCKYGKKGEMKSASRQKIDDRIAKMYEFVEIWKIYELKMNETGSIDFDDQIRFVVEALGTNESLKSDLQEKYQFILVDEYQDTNSAQNQIIWHLADFDDAPNIFAVGDDDQSIYRFQGASLENIVEFRENFPDTQTISLTKNYRSAQKILDAAFTVVGNNKERIDVEKVLTSSGVNKEFEGKIEKAIFPSRFSELIFIAERIQAAIKSGTSLDQMAILVRENKEVKEVAEHLQKFGITTRTKVAENILEDQNVKYLIQMLRIFDDPSLDYEFFDFLHAPFLDISSHEIFDLTIVTNNGRKNVLKILNDRCRNEEASKEKIPKNAVQLPGMETEPESQISKIFKIFVKGHKAYHHQHPARIAENLFYESGLADFILHKGNTNRINDLLKIQKLFDWMTKQVSTLHQTNPHFNPLQEVLKIIDLHIELNIPIFPDSPPSDAQAVQVMTAHKSKGMEFDIVFIPGLVDKVWGNKRSRSGIPLPELFAQHHDQNEDERRLFFVAMTRSKKDLILSYAEKDFSDREKLPSQFWHEIPEEHCEIVTTDVIQAKAQELIPTFFATPTTPLLTGDEKDILSKLVTDYVWSASSLQDYLDCPRKFLYTRLLRMPTRKNKHFSLGIAVHQALQRLLEQLRDTGVLPGEAYFLKVFETTLIGEKLNPAEYKNCLHHGKELLTRYYKENQTKFSSNVELEYNFRKYNPKISDISVTGKMDKIEISDDNKSVVIVDYKSGKPKTIKHGESLWRQLVFYDLMARNTPEFKWTVDSLVLDFLRPDPRTDKLEQKVLVVTEKDRAQVESELKEANERLQNLEFSMVDNEKNDEEIAYWQKF